MIELSTIGIVLYIIYPVIVIFVSVYTLHNREVTLESYFFANRNTPWWILGISFITASMFGPYIFGLTASGLDAYLPLVYGLVSIIMLSILGPVLAPMYLKLRINTFPEYFEIRFNRTCRLFLSALYIFYNIFFRLAIILVAGSIFINLVTGYDAFTSLIYFLVITGVYVIIGGLQTEINVNVVQVMFIAIGAFTFAAWILLHNSNSEVNTTRLVSLSTIPQQTDSEFSTTGLIAGLPIIGFWFWCADQFMVQKVLSSRNTSHVRKATLLSIFLQVIPVLIFVLPAILIATLFEGSNPNDILQKLFSGNYLPAGVRYSVIVAVASALMASFASVFNSTSILVTFDFYRTLKPDSSDRKLVLVGRLTILLLLFCSILLIPTSQSIDFSICLRLFKTCAYFFAMITSVFIIGLLNKKIKAFSAFLTLCIVTVIIILRTVLEILFNSRDFDNDLFDWLSHSDFLEFSAFIFFISIISIFISSWLSQGDYKANILLRNSKAQLLKLKYKWNAHRKVFLILLLLIVI